jgi:hypothetical protein
MNRWFLSIIFIFSLFFSAEVNLSIDNFVDDGEGNVTFDIMMTNSVEIKGFEMVFSSGNGGYDGGVDCRCDQGDDSLPTGCEDNQHLHHTHHSQRKKPSQILLSPRYLSS